ncbi:Hypothetical predicted protein, partial [Paramuricea clavata]
MSSQKKQGKSSTKKFIPLPMEKSKPVVVDASAETRRAKTSSSQITASQDDSHALGNANSFSKADKHPSTSRSFAEKRKTIAYIQSLSPEKRNRKDTLNYSSLTLQTAEGTKQALCFSKSKRKLLKERFDNKTAVEIYNHTVSNDGKIFINEMTQVSNAQPGDYFFQFEEIPDQYPLRSLNDIIKEAKSMDMVNFSAKVVSKGPTETARNLKLARCVVADSPSSCMTLVLWQEHIDQMAYTLDAVIEAIDNETFALDASGISSDEEEDLDRRLVMSDSDPRQ